MRKSRDFSKTEPHKSKCSIHDGICFFFQRWANGVLSQIIMLGVCIGFCSACAFLSLQKENKLMIMYAMYAYIIDILDK